ncbi:SDR family NAD(P)-dependent oxidoreductase [Nocardia miyunensis]|uniref:SDR family NAD(P)-dependent oxidoreductase n=1 Tax=Nocardia miyunensis TaxID=282684 RepID=UPI000836BEA8|nr:SDR family NAD(P)-dependent oxidoreductase [Nocardia miyunensis]
MTALDGGTALVTGAAHGIGRALVLELARAGYAVVTVDVNGEAAEQVAGEARDLGAKALPVRCATAVSTNIQRSGEVRPQHLGEDSGRPADAPSTSYAIAAALDPADVARMALDGVREDRAWVFTDPATRELLEKRHHELIEAFGT